jgi:NAD(P)-dependent dehydrogenase (short-subunit alcohol dehydrogenase family)
MGLLEDKVGSIIAATSGIGARTAEPFVAEGASRFSSSMVRGAAKAAVNHLTRCVAIKLGDSNVRVNSLSPGAIATGILPKALRRVRAALGV